MPRHRHDKPIATAAATFGACNRTGVHCLRHVLFEEMIALALNFAVEVLQTVIQVIAGPSRQNFFTASLLFHSGLRPHRKRRLAVVHLGVEVGVQKK